ncbi:MAG: AbrB/MazE/SpoVT family DNA-binding domain-containing protein [Candidatus Heimdallarchaeota archaeon]|nr:AbrB/MazE/SpoVT family DNA-binding domain-containing protein [Candidatus Heimdallarchaeota archaeon]
MSENNTIESTIDLNITENHNLLYFNIPKTIIQKLNLTESDLLEFDVRENHFFIRKKGSQTLPKDVKHNIFTGLLVERNITRNNTVLRTNLPKEVALPLTIQKGDQVGLSINGNLIIGRKNKLK